jgi:hypothetical protein
VVRKKSHRTLIAFVILNIPFFIGTLFIRPADGAPPAWMILPIMYILIASFLFLMYLAFKLIDWVNAGEDS